MKVGDNPTIDRVFGVVALVELEWDAIEADFLRYYRLDLGAACWGDNHIGLKRIWTLIHALPPESALARSMGWSWTDALELAAMAVEVKVNGYRDKSDPMFRYPRPYDEVEEPVPLTRGGVRAAFMGGAI
ncbi:MAG: hypothetical protein ABIP03_11695 [Aquihabitans sp.]